MFLEIFSVTVILKKQINAQNASFLTFIKKRILRNGFSKYILNLIKTVYTFITTIFEEEF